jgi:hypothetical protein
MPTSSNFDSADGDGYELQMGRWSRRLALPFLDFAGLADAERVLDVGCGTGSLSGALVERANVRRVDGIDFSDVYVEQRIGETSCEFPGSDNAVLRWSTTTTRTPPPVSEPETSCPLAKSRLTSSTASPSSTYGVRRPVRFCLPRWPSVTQRAFAIRT